ncbi:MAG: sugar ABC transporter ATP-binding protein [candidate division Zixibacteria bacterium]|nr:sugar ABC transporter ATP-binding protein [candidate division Zixibacteria bacterium]
MSVHSDSSNGIPTRYSHPLLAALELTKSFPGVQALRDISFDLRSGEIHALVGENGAGKSTLVKILTGVHIPDNGSVMVDGTQVSFGNPLEIMRLGVKAIYQELSLVPALSVHANLFLGQERTTAGIINDGNERRIAADVLARLGVEIDPDALVRSLSVAQQQMVEIGRALVSNCRILILDEPTAALSPTEVARLFDILRELVRQKLGIVFISHRLEEVLQIANRVTVLRDGAVVTTREKSELSRQQLIEFMVGRSLENEFPTRQSAEIRDGLEVRNLSGDRVHDITFVAHRGEVLGLAGLMGSGRTEIARLIFGADRANTGSVTLDGRMVDIKSPRDAIRSGICLLTEDRKTQGLVLKLSAQDNFALGNLSRWSQRGWINDRLERSRFRNHVDALRIRLADPKQHAETLSGGNQQKLLVARWLEAESQVVIFDEPTRGIDVGARYEMYCLINELTSLRKAVIVISSELPELLGMCDRLLVMRRGRIAGEITEVQDASQEQVMALAV